MREKEDQLHSIHLSLGDLHRPHPLHSSAMHLTREAMATMRFQKNHKKATPVEVPTVNSRPPVSRKYFDLTDDPTANQQNQRKLNPSFTNTPNLVWDNERGLVDPPPPSPKYQTTTLPKRINPRHKYRCQDLPLAQTIPTRTKSTSATRRNANYPPTPPPPKTKQTTLRPSPKPTLNKSTTSNPSASPPPTRKKPLRRKRNTQPSSIPEPPPRKLPSASAKNPTLKLRGCSSPASSTLSDVHLPTRSPCSESVSTSAIGGASSSASLDILKDMRDTLSLRGISLQTQPLNPRINFHTDNNEWGDLVQPEDLSMENAQMINNPESTCPFCDEPLPNKPSHKLTKLLQYLKSKPEVTRRPESMNPLALYLPFSDTASYCELHRAERKLIPDGIKKGWPTTIDFQALPKRIRSYRQHLHRVCTRDVCSYFMRMALKHWEAQGPRKAQSVASELATFQVEQPGYYGVQGYEMIYRTLQHMFLKSSGNIDSIINSAKPLPPDFLLRKVLVPETAMCLISQDLRLDINHPKVLETLEDSRSFGTMMFPDQDDRMDSSSGEKSELDEEDDQQLISPPSPKRHKRKGLRESISCEIEILNGTKFSPRKNLTKSTESRKAPLKTNPTYSHFSNLRSKQTSMNGLDNPSSSSKPFAPHKPLSMHVKAEHNKKSRYPVLGEGWESTISH